MNNHLKLFSVVHNSDNKILIRYTGESKGRTTSQHAYFCNKKEAKEFRDFLNAQVSNPADKVHVSKGPDHKDYKGA